MLIQTLIFMGVLFLVWGSGEYVKLRVLRWGNLYEQEEILAEMKIRSHADDIGEGEWDGWRWLELRYRFEWLSANFDRRLKEPFWKPTAWKDL